MSHPYLQRAALITVVSFATLQSCNRRADLPSPTATDSQSAAAVTTANAKSWYEAGVAPGKHLALPIYWDKAQVIQVGKEEHLIVPIGDTQDRFAASPYRAYRRLIIRQRNSEPLEGTIVEVLVQRSEQQSDLEHVFHDLYLAQRNKERLAPPESSGAAFFYTADYAYLTGYRYSQGRAETESTTLLMKAAPAQLKAGRGVDSLPGLTAMTNDEEGPGPGFPGSPDPYHPLDPITVSPPPNYSPPYDPFPAPGPSYPTDPNPLPPPPPGGGGPTDGGWGGPPPGGNVNGPTTINAGKFRINIANEILTPKLVQTLRGIRALVQANPDLLKALMKFSGRTEAQILANLTYGSGPEVKLGQPKDKDGKAVIGSFSSNGNTITLDGAFINQLEHTTSASASEALVFYLSITLLHEYVHYGDNLGGRTYVGEAGEAFEKHVFGVLIDYDNAPYLVDFLNKP